MFFLAEADYIRDSPQGSGLLIHGVPTSPAPGDFDRARRSLKVSANICVQFTSPSRWVVDITRKKIPSKNAFPVESVVRMLHRLSRSRTKPLFDTLAKAN